MPPSQAVPEAGVIGGAVAALIFVCAVGAACFAMHRRHRRRRRCDDVAQHAGHRAVGDVGCGAPGSEASDEARQAARRGDRVLPYKASMPFASEAVEKGAKDDDPAQPVVPATIPSDLEVEELC